MLTRKMLKGMSLTDEQIDTIIEAHTETVNALKDERDKLKDDASNLADVSKELENVKKELEAVKSGDWEKKYNSLKSEYDGYKTDVETKALKAKKADAYKKLLKDAGVSEKRFDSILKVTPLDDVKLDKDGNIEDADKYTKNITDEWADFIVTKQQKGADTPTPPVNAGGDAVNTSRAAQRAAKYYSEHYGNAITKKED